MIRLPRWTRFHRTVPVLLCGALLLGLAACEPTPSYLQRWANTPDSEEKFAAYLLDPDLSHEVHVKALELLVEQWDYSSGMLFNGGTVKDMPDAAERDATLRDATPRIRALYDQGGAWHYKMRDAAYHLRAATEDASVREGLDAIVVDWVVNHWDPCQANNGVVRVIELLEVAGQAAAETKMAEIVRESPFDRVICFGRETNGGVEWIRSSTAIAEAYTTRWDSGEIGESEQIRFEMIEDMAALHQVEAMRAWMFAKLRDADFEPLFKNAILDVLSNNPSDSDVEGYRTLLANETNARWGAMQQILNARGSDGLAFVLDNLPAEGEYGFYRGEIQADGLRSVANEIVCVMPKLQELGDNARRVFERYVASENLPVRALAIGCLARFGDSQTLGRLTEARAALGRTPPAAPRWGEGATFELVIDEAIAAIQARQQQ